MRRGGKWSGHVCRLPLGSGGPSHSPWESCLGPSWRAAARQTVKTKPTRRLSPSTKASDPRNSHGLALFGFLCPVGSAAKGRPRGRLMAQDASLPSPALHRVQQPRPCPGPRSIQGWGPMPVEQVFLEADVVSLSSLSLKFLIPRVVSVIR